MGNSAEQEEGNLMLMVSPTTGRVLLVLPNNMVGFSGLESVDAFADRLVDELAAVKRLFGQGDGVPISDDYGSRAISEWETTLKESRSDDEESSGGSSFTEPGID